MTDAPWTEEDLAELARLWARTDPELSITTIGVLMGRTRNAVSSKVRRLNLPNRVTHPNFAHVVHPRGAHVVHPRGAREVAEAMARSEHERSVQRADAARVERQAPAPRRRAPDLFFVSSSQTCTWTECEKRPWIFCDEPALIGKNWCLTHHRRV